MNKYLKYIAPLGFLLSLILILLCRAVPSGKLWKNYTVLSVPKNTDDSVVMAAIENSGIKNVVSLSGQYLPLTLSENSVEISMLRLNYNNPEYSYLNKRRAFFFDKSEAYRLYYIPSEYSNEASLLIKTLESRGIACSKDSSANYPWLLPLIGILLAAMLFLFSKNKIPFACGVLIPLVFLYSNPFYPVATSTCLVILCLFFISNVWGRKDALASILSRHSIPAMAGIAFLCTFSSSIASGFLFLAAFAGTASALLTCHYVESFFRNKKPFVPVYIRSARRVSLFAGRALSSMSIVTGATLLFVLLIFITSSNSVKTTSSKILFPAASGFHDKALPQFEDYYKWTWNVKTLPYRTLNDSDSKSESQDENQVTFSSFVENESTGIITEEKTVMKYDDSFRKEAFDNIDKLQFDSVEKMMKSEGENFSAGYTSASSYQINLFGIIMCFICLFILLFIYFSIIIRKGIFK